MAHLPFTITNSNDTNAAFSFLEQLFNTNSTPMHASFYYPLQQYCMLDSQFEMYSRVCEVMKTHGVVVAAVEVEGLTQNLNRFALLFIVAVLFVLYMYVLFSYV